MMSLRQVIGCALTALCVVATVTKAEAGVITFQATDLADGGGGDLWMYEYSLTGFSFAVNQGFSIYFDPTSYASLESPPPAVSPDWDIISVQPDAALPSDGFYDALALTANPSLSQLFSVTFVWLGGAGTSPGTQPFTINQFDAFGNVSFIDTGDTSAQGSPTPVPEPAALWLMAAGWWTYRRRSARRARTSVR